MTPTVLLADSAAGAAGLPVVGEAADGAEVLPAVRRSRPDVVLMDVRMPGTDGIEATRQVLAALDDPLLAGASGFLLKRARREEIAHAVGDRRRRAGSTRGRRKRSPGAKPRCSG